MSAIVPGFECDFTERPPGFVRTCCPICLLILRNPHQVTCCGKSFCENCIQQVKKQSLLCPTCKQEEFEVFPDKGLQQELYSFLVFCCNRSEGCDWQGELGELEKHLNLNPDKERQIIGCSYAKIKCIYCFKHHRRFKIENHQLSQCLKRPFTCEMCLEYESTYSDVTTNHAPLCKCRPVDCPNECGHDNLQHHNFEEHLSNHCPLSLVECEFSHAGCDIKLYRKDLPTHLTDNIITHMSLLASENERIKLLLQKQAKDLTSMVKRKTKRDREYFKLLLKKKSAVINRVRKRHSENTRFIRFRRRVKKRLK